jgi:LPS export ABC transporter protein LptC
MVLVQQTWENIPVLSYLPGQSRGQQPGVRLRNFHLVDVFQHRKKWELVATMAQSIEESGDIVRLHNLEMTFFPSPASPPLKLMAQRGELNTTTRAVVVKGNVHLDNGQGYVLITDSLTWDPLEQVLYTKDLVRIRGGGLEIEGRGFRSDATGREMKVQEAVRAKVFPTS